MSIAHATDAQRARDARTGPADPVPALARLPGAPRGPRATVALPPSDPRSSGAPDPQEPGRPISGAGRRRERSDQRWHSGAFGRMGGTHRIAGSLSYGTTNKPGAKRRASGGEGRAAARSSGAQSRLPSHLGRTPPRSLDCRRARANRDACTRSRAARPCHVRGPRQGERSPPRPAVTTSETGPRWLMECAGEQRALTAFRPP
jgi:hypothetical protein